MSVETRVLPTLVLFVLELWGIGTAVFGAIVPRRRPCRVLFLRELHVLFRAVFWLRYQPAPAFSVG